MQLSPKELELAAISISIAAGCNPCTTYHIKEAISQSASDSELTAAVRTGATVSERSLLEIWTTFDDGVDRSKPETLPDGVERQAILCAAGSAVARNNVRLLRQLIETARASGIGDSHLMEIAGLARRIKQKAASHLDPVLAKLEADISIARKAARLCT